jgi:hypothetical protein
MILALKIIVGAGILAVIAVVAVLVIAVFFTDYSK